MSLDGLAAALVSGGLVVDVALAVIALEAVAVWWIGRRRGSPTVADVAPFLVAGAGLLIALRAALVGWPPAVTLAGLTVAGLAHAIDLIRRLRR